MTDDASIVQELRTEIAAGLQARIEVLTDAVCSAIFGHIAPYLALAGPGRIESFHAAVRQGLVAYCATIAEQRPLSEAELAHFRRIGAERARQDFPLDAVVDAVDVALAACWRFIRDALHDIEDGHVAADLAVDLALETFAGAKVVVDALTTGHTVETQRGTYGRVRAVAGFVARLLDGWWADEYEADRLARGLGVDPGRSCLLLLVTFSDAYTAGDLEMAARELGAVVRDALVGATRLEPTPHVPVVVPTPPGPPAPAVLEAVSTVAQARRGLLVLVPDASCPQADLPRLYRQQADEIVCARAARPDAPVVFGVESHAYRVLRTIPLTTRVDFVRAVLGPILDLAPSKAAETLDTLETHFFGRARPDETGTDPRGSRHSFRYRLERSQVLLGVNLRHGPDRFRVELALALRRLAQEEVALLDGTDRDGEDEEDEEDEGSRPRRRGRRS